MVIEEVEMDLEEEEIEMIEIEEDLDSKIEE